jgi:hypothetical protein
LINVAANNKKILTTPLSTKKPNSSSKTKTYKELMQYYLEGKKKIEIQNKSKEKS